MPNVQKEIADKMALYFPPTGSAEPMPPPERPWTPASVNHAFAALEAERLEAIQEAGGEDASPKRVSRINTKHVRNARGLAARVHSEVEQDFPTGPGATAQRIGVKLAARGLADQAARHEAVPDPIEED